VSPALILIAHMLGGVGSLMGNGLSTPTPPGGGFAILTEANDPLATESSSILVTEDAP